MSMGTLRNGGKDRGRGLRRVGIERTREV